MQQTLPQTYTPSLSDNSSIDFAIWTLTHFGIHYPPFDCHPIQQNPHFTSDQWYQWLKRLVRQFDGRLRFDPINHKTDADHLKEIESLKQNVKQFAPHMSFTAEHWDEILEQKRTDSKALHIEKVHSYQQALQEWGITDAEINDINTPAHELFEGSPQTVKLLGQLWSIRGDSRETIAYKVASIYITNRINCTTPRDNIEIYFVNYPKLTSMYVHPNTILISLTDEFTDVDHFNRYIQDSIDTYIAA